MSNRPLILLCAVLSFASAAAAEEQPMVQGLRFVTHAQRAIPVQDLTQPGNPVCQLSSAQGCDLPVGPGEHRVLIGNVVHVFSVGPGQTTFQVFVDSDFSLAWNSGVVFLAGLSLGGLGIVLAVLPFTWWLGLAAPIVALLIAAAFAIVTGVVLFDRELTRPRFLIAPLPGGSGRTPAPSGGASRPGADARDRTRP